MIGPQGGPIGGKRQMAKAKMAIASKKYGPGRCAAGALQARRLEEEVVSATTPDRGGASSAVASSWCLLTHDGVKVWDTLACRIPHELSPGAGLMPADVAAARAAAPSPARCIRDSPTALGAAMNIKAHYPGFKLWAGAQGDIERIGRSGASACAIERALPVRPGPLHGHAMFARSPRAS